MRAQVQPGCIDPCLPAHARPRGSQLLVQPGHPVQTLREHGVTFATFEAEGLTWVDGVASYGGLKSAWFEDLDGNGLGLYEGTTDTSA